MNKKFPTEENNSEMELQWRAFRNRYVKNIGEDII